nr:uncharacterized protein LOC111419598 [Onthophagus taurus]
MENIISLQDCENIIKKYSGDQIVENFQLIPLDTKLGLLGEYFKLKIKFYDKQREQKEKQFFVKTLALTECQRKFTLDNGVAIKEEWFYSKFVEKCLINGIEIIQDCVPKCYLIQRLNKFVLSLENYQVLDAQKCLSPQEVQIALEKLAKFHASTYILEESLSKRKAYRISNEFSEFLKESLYCTETEIAKQYIESMKTGVRTHIDLCKNVINEFDDEDIKKKIIKIIDDYPIYVKPSLKYRNVICHGDLWSANTMYKYKNKIPVDLKMVDFQMYRYNPPSSDVITFLYFCTNRKFREEHLKYCFNFYWDQLRSVLKKYDLDVETIFSREHFFESVEYYKKFAICQASTHGHISMIDSKLLSDILFNPESVTEFMTKSRSDIMEKMFEKDAL